MIPYDEFGLFRENAEEFGIPWAGPPAVRRASTDLGDGRRLSALVWGRRAPELALLHGGAQNAHTWDTVALALDRPVVCIDLPGHGHSDAAADGTLNFHRNAQDVARAIGELAPHARGVVGMSLGGMTTLALAQQFPELVRAAVLVDVTPGVDETKARAITAFVNGPDSFPNFEALLARTIEHNPTRSVSSLRRGILHNAEQRTDGSWVWRYRRFFEPDRRGSFPRFADMWEVISAMRAPLMLVRGMRDQSVVTDADEAELVRRCPGARVEHIREAGHSVQGDTPVELARLLEDFLFAGNA
ncbi:MAG TPA: alpha/beta hydrolase [Myxococcota bacterium]|nr:alpha/beta hydrolase [Myxococcota bacterium]